MIVKKSVLILGAGSGTRMNSKLPKQYILIKDKPIIFHTIEKFSHFDEIVVVINKNHTSFFEKHLNDKYVWSLVNELDDKVCYIKTSMGEEKIYLRDDDDIIYSVKRIHETIKNLDAIYKEEELIDKYCSENGWTYSGT